MALETARTFDLECPKGSRCPTRDASQRENGILVSAATLSAELSQGPLKTRRSFGQGLGLAYTRARDSVVRERFASPTAGQI